MSNHSWYYVVDGARVGPVEETEITRLVQAGTITANTLVWREGLDGWVPASDHFNIAAAGSPPPMPDTAPPQAAIPHSRPGVQQPLYEGAPARGFGEAINVCLNKYVDFKGRASRSEYWYFVLFTFILGFVTGLLDGLLFPGNAVSPLNSLVSLALFLPALAVAMRRLHDTNRSGWWIGGYYLGILIYAVIVGVVIGTSTYDDPSGGILAFIGIGAIAILGFTITLLVFFCLRGDPGPNHYG
ncbi:DUF805 domain-containing protein [Octadecabacter sp. R77987]|uniref:DUF805 domain-containing protein n=1 Tax=Octadecabacter sp. R77987 TaxID=3093874 RepID=UPI0036714250